MKATAAARSSRVYINIYLLYVCMRVRVCVYIINIYIRHLHEYNAGKKMCVYTYIKTKYAIRRSLSGSLFKNQPR